jgi:predicted O-linked N-acetylglucosamine transferase (SPINDLY family)
MLDEAREHFQMGRVAQADSLFRRILEIEPSHAQSLYMLGGIALNDRDTTAAIDFVRRAIKADPDNATYHFSLATVLVTTGRSAEAIPSLQEAVRLKPDEPEWRRHLAAALQATGQGAGAPTSVGPSQSATDAQGFVDFAETLRQLGRPKEAEDALREALRLAPTMAAAHSALAAIHLEQGRPVESEAAARKAVENGPESAESWFALAMALSGQARHVEATACLRQTIALRPDWEVAWNLLLFSMNYSDHWSAQEIYAAHVEWGERLVCSARLPIEPSHRAPGHRIRIGYLSPDYRYHPVAFFIEAPLKHHDRSKFEVFCYHTDGRVDAMTQNLKTLADHWRWMVAPSEQALRQVIREDGIDILVELSGHTLGHRLNMLADRAAPIQITYLGYPNTTGLRAIDYRITDARADPPEQAESLHVEKLMHLPQSFLCYTPPKSANLVGPPPVLRNGFVTFGSFNNFAKLSPTVIRLWARVLAAVPGSQLMIKTQGVQDPGLRALLLSALERAGVDHERVRIASPTISHSEHMDSYAEVDIALDTFPYHGTTTTLDALWMGVPVVTLVGDRHASRVGFSILACLGLTDLIAHSAQEYVAVAARLAAAPEKLAQLRTTLRARLAESTLTNGEGFTAELEQLYSDIWAEALSAIPAPPDS